MEAPGPPVAARPALQAPHESFFDAVARHRRAAWRVSVVSTVADLAIALIVAALMSPLFFAVLVLLFDLANLVVRVPDLASVIAAQVGPMFDVPRQVTLSHWALVSGCAVLPGLVWMALVTIALRRVMTSSAMFNAGGVAAREPDLEVLAEHRFADVVKEMAIAANLPPPRVLVVERQGFDAAVFGRDESHATVVFGSRILEALSRDELEAVAAHLVGSIADGDMAIGLHVATTSSLFGLLGRLTGVLDARAEVGATAGATPALRRPVPDPGLDGGARARTGTTRSRMMRRRRPREAPGRHPRLHRQRAPATTGAATSGCR